MLRSARYIAFRKEIALKESLAIVSGALFLLGFVPYILAIMRGKAVPTRSTWIVWFANDVMALCSMYAKDALNFLIVGATIGAFVVMLLSFSYGERGWSRLDKACIAIAAAGIALWATSGDALLALIASQSAAFIGGVPLIVNAWKDPSREDRLAMMMFGAATILTFVVLPDFTFARVLQPFNFLVTMVTINVIIWLRPRTSPAPDSDPGKAA